MHIFNNIGRFLGRFDPKRHYFFNTME